MTPKAQTTKVKLDHGITLNLKKHNDLRDQNHNITSHYQMYCVAIIKKQKCKVCGEDVEKTESLYIVGGNINWYNLQEKNYGGSSKDKNGQPYDLAIQLLDIYPKEMKLGTWERYIHTHVNCSNIDNSQNMYAN